MTDPQTVQVFTDPERPKDATTPQDGALCELCERRPVACVNNRCATCHAEHCGPGRPGLHDPHGIAE